MLRHVRKHYLTADTLTRIRAQVFFVVLAVSLTLFLITAVYDYSTGYFLARIGNKFAIPILTICLILVYSGRLYQALHIALFGISVAAVIGVVFGPLSFNHILGMPFLIILCLYFENLRFTVIGVTTTVTVVTVFMIRLHLAGRLETRFVLDSVTLFLPFVVMAVMLVRNLQHNLTEKEALLREVHHRVKNNLQLIQSLLRLEAAKRGEDPRFLDRINSIAAIHEILYSSGLFGSVNMHDLTGKIVAWQKRRSGYRECRVSVVMPEADPPALSLDRATPVALIMNELVSNALVHGVRDGGDSEVSIICERVEGGMRIRVRDDGPGFPEGFLKEPPGTMGLMLVDLLAGQIGAAVRLDRSGGTTVEVRVPLH